ncbi:hypothetical protein [Phenylobacterium deserti]|uniref:Disulfide bond formation protein B n=1 Tax=Phenylobacterium deserti TaxID=1914756 RepID=A0A328ACY4_9CAUL|nr:hypothetical protein [Phenylobacterium deserti]RAK52529.1 hypothetical protein DJ018_09960 [Phenylobacterium deserti]
MSQAASRDLTFLGIGLLASAAMSGVLAWLHMRALSQAYGVICGSGGGELAHCPACYAAVGFLASGLLALAVAALPRMRRLKAAA